MPIMIQPPIQRGITVLNRELFRREVSAIGIRVSSRSIAKFLKVLNKYVLNSCWFWILLSYKAFLYAETVSCSINQS